MNTNLKNAIQKEIISMNEEKISRDQLSILIDALSESKFLYAQYGIDLNDLIVYHNSRFYSLRPKLFDHFQSQEFYLSEVTILTTQIEQKIISFWFDQIGVQSFQNLNKYIKVDRVQLNFKTIPDAILKFLALSQYPVDDFKMLAKVFNLSYYDLFYRLVSSSYDQYDVTDLPYFVLFLDPINNFMQSEGIFTDCLYSDRFDIYYPDCESFDSNRGITDCGKWFESRNYKWSESQELYIHPNDAVQVNSEWYSLDYVENNFFWCDECEEWDTESHDHEPSYCLKNYSFDVLQTSNYCYYNDLHQPKKLYRIETYRPNNPVVIGLELEVFGDSDRLLSELQGNEGDGWALCSDGSVSAELKMAPRTLASWQNCDDLITVLEAMKKSGCSGHVNSKVISRTAGIHLHVNRGSVSLLQIKKLDFALHQRQNQAFFERIAQRQYRELDYCSLQADFNYSDRHISDKYLPVNYKHSNSYEIRIFNSNLRFERVLKNIEFLESFLSWTNEISFFQLLNNSVRSLGYVDFVAKNKKSYPNLHEYLS